MSEENLDIPMAQCGACDSIVPLDSESCPNCGVRFGGVADEQLGECGACSALIPADSESCPECGVSFVAVEEPQAEETIEETQVTDVPENLDDLNDIILPETEVSEPVVEAEESPVEETITEESETDVAIENQVSEVEDDSPIDEEDESAVDEVDIDSLIDDVEDTTSEEASQEDEVTETVAENESIIASIEDETTEEEVAETQDEPEDEVSEEINEEEDSENTEDSETVEDEEQEADSVDESSEEADDEESVEDTTEDEEEAVDDGIDDVAIALAFDNLALAIADSGMTAAEAFGEIDTSDDQMIDAPELQKGIEKIAGEKLSPKHVTAILNYLDKDGNRRVDPAELIKALEDLRIGIQPGKMPKVKNFPSPAQKFLMGKKANDIFYPIAYFLMVTFIGIWVVNGVGLLVDGTGGTIVYEGGIDEFGDDIEVTSWNLCQSDVLDEIPEPCFGTVEVGQTYPCDPAVDENKCANSLTPFSGEKGASSMPAGFYGDGITMIILGVIGLAVTAYLHLIYAPALREKAREKSGKTDSEDSEEEEEIEDDSEDENEEEDGALDAPKDLVIDDENDDEDSDDEEDELEDEDDEDYADDIDIGSRVGVEDEEGGEWFGTVVEFDEDDDSILYVKDEDNGEEYEVEMKNVFVLEEDDE